MLQRSDSDGRALVSSPSALAEDVYAPDYIQQAHYKGETCRE